MPLALTASSSAAGAQPLALTGAAPLPPTSNAPMPSGQQQQQQQHLLQIAAAPTIAPGGTANDGGAGAAGAGDGGRPPVDTSRRRSGGDQQLSAAAHAQQQQQQHLMGKSGGGGAGHTSSSRSGKGNASVHANVPIILVPSATQTLLNVFNAKEFLEDAVYVSPEGKMREMKRPEVVTIERKIGRDKPVLYQVRDKPELLSKRVRMSDSMGALCAVALGA